MTREYTHEFERTGKPEPSRLGSMRRYEKTELYKGKKLIIFNGLIVPGTVKDKNYQYKDDEFGHKVSDADPIPKELIEDVVEFLHKKGYYGDGKRRFGFWTEKKDEDIWSEEKDEESLKKDNK